MKTILLGLVALFSISQTALAEETCATTALSRAAEYQQTGPARGATLRIPKRAKAYTTVASGRLSFRSSNCGQPSSTVLDTRLIITQNGRNFFVRIPSGRVLRGQGNRSGFIVRGQSVQNGIMVYDELRAGPVRSGKAQFTLSLSAGRCLVVFGGKLRVGF